MYLTNSPMNGTIIEPTRAAVEQKPRVTDRIGVGKISFAYTYITANTPEIPSFPIDANTVVAMDTLSPDWQKKEW